MAKPVRKAIKSGPKPKASVKDVATPVVKPVAKPAPVVPSEGGVDKKKKYSKNKKKNWGRFIDMKEMDEFLEDESLANRIGGRVEDKKDEELFVIDNKPSEVEAEIVAAPVLRRKKRVVKPLRIAKVLQSNPKVKAVGIQSKTKPKGDPTTLSKKIARQVNAVVASTATVAASTTLAGVKKDTRIHDVWDDAREVVVLPNQLPQAKMPDTTARITTKLPAIETVHPGQSYNPSFDDHQKALDKAVTKISAEEKTQAYWRARAEGINQPVSVEQYTAEMKLGFDEEGNLKLFSDGEDEEEEEAVEKEEGEEAKPIRAEDRKTRQQRTREKRLKEEMKKKLADKEERMNASEVYRLRNIKRSIEEKDKEIEENTKKNEEKKKMKLYQPARMSRFKFIEEPIDVQLTEELAGSLRTMKPEGNVMKDRF
eukprot:Ihof_evm2s68 gene=Ihof_evmTU2s68